jgi:competence protein ComEA
MVRLWRPRDAVQFVTFKRLSAPLFYRSVVSGRNSGQLFYIFERIDLFVEMKRPDRRTFLRVSSAAGLLGIAGCSETGELESRGDDDDTEGDSDLVDLNTASKQNLTELPGVGEQRATAIIDYRENRSDPITDPYQLTESSGITRDLVDSWDGLVTPPLGGTDTATPSESDLVDLNTASKQDLTELPGVGEQRATQIIDYRETRSDPITDPYQLTEVSGITRSLVDSWAGLVTPPLGGEDGPSSDLVDLNTASKQDLTELPGVGEQRATAIVDYRQNRSDPITDPYQLTEISTLTRSVVDGWAGLVTPPLGGEDGPNSDLVDLNTASRQDLTQLPGVGEQRATAIIDYRENRSDPLTDPYQLTEISVISRDLVDGWAGLVTPPLGGEDEPSGDLVNLNTASRQDLTQLPGVGEQRATQIIDYRETRSDRITDPYQLTEVSVISRDLVDGWAGLVTPPLGGEDGPSGDLIDLNTANKQELTELPGVGEQRATGIIDYREDRSGSITDPYQLTESSLITRSVVDSWAGFVTPPLGGEDGPSGDLSCTDITNGYERQDVGPRPVIFDFDRPALFDELVFTQIGSLVYYEDSQSSDSVSINMTLQQVTDPGESSGDTPDSSIVTTTFNGEEVTFGGYSSGSEIILFGNLPYRFEGQRETFTMTLILSYSGESSNECGDALREAAEHIVNSIEFNSETTLGN